MLLLDTVVLVPDIRLVNANRAPCYDVTVVHSKKAMMSSVTLLRDDKIRAIAHVIGNNQLPVPCREELSPVSIFFVDSSFLGVS